MTKTRRRAGTIVGALAAAVVMAFAPRAEAQTVDHEYQTWLGLFAQGPIHGRLFFQGDLHYRVYANFTPYAALVRPGVAWQLMPGMFVTLGYAWTPSWSQPDQGVEDLIDEHRLWEQWQYEFPLATGALRLQLRTRLEERWRPSVGGDTGVRFRQMVRVTVPLGASGRWVLAAWDELFFGLNDTDWRQRQGFDQNRAFGGVGYWFVPGALRVEAGYFNQYVQRPGNPAGDLSNHALMVNTYVSWR